MTCHVLVVGWYLFVGMSECRNDGMIVIAEATGDW